MDLCTDCDIAHDQGMYSCPLCAANERIKELERQGQSLEEERDELQNELHIVQERSN